MERNRDRYRTPSETRIVDIYTLRERAASERVDKILFTIYLLGMAGWVIAVCG